ncbi:hypothetical protein GCM10009743_59610 [Kribbella swartbergensis]
MTKNSGNAWATASATPWELLDTPSGVYVPLALITTLNRYRSWMLMVVLTVMVTDSGWRDSVGS